MTTRPSTIQAGNAVAIDVHVHLEAPTDGSAADVAARQYFGDSGAARDAHSLAEYYRSRRMACVVFSVDERLSGRPQLSNDEVADFAAAKAIATSAFAAAKSATSSFESCGRPDSRSSTENTTHAMRRDR